MQSNEIGKLAEALALAQREIKPARKSATNPHFKSDHCTLEDVNAVCREPLAKNSLAVVHYAQCISGPWVLTTKIMHSSGQWVSGCFPLIVEKQTAQGYGSAVTYAKRYNLMALLNIASSDEEDDGETAEGRGTSGNKEQEILPAPYSKPMHGQPFKAITKKQADFLESVIKARQEVQDAILDLCKVPFIDDIPASMFDAAMKMAREYSSQKVAV